MINWAEKGREILTNCPDLPPQERELMEAKIKDVELTAALLPKPQSETAPAQQTVEKAVEAAGSVTVTKKPNQAEHLERVVAELKRGSRTSELYTNSIEYS